MPGQDARSRRAASEAETLPNEARLMDLFAIAAAGGVSLRTARAWTASGRLRVTKLGRAVRVRLSDWLEFLGQRGAS